MNFPREFVANSSDFEFYHLGLHKAFFETYIDKFDMSMFRQNDIYPDIWEYEEEADEIKDELRTSFESLKKFYEKMAEQGRAVLVSIY